MTDEADLTPEREAAVRRLLGSVCDDVPALPAEVAGRLDATLGDLVAERAAPVEHLAPVVPISSRRRKAFAALFVAAAAVVVAGIGVPLLHDHTPTSATASSDKAVSRTAGVGAAAPSSPQLDSSYDTMGNTATGLRGPGAHSQRATRGAVALRSHTLRADLLRLRRRVPPDATYRSATVHAPVGFTCMRADFGRGYLLGERYAGAPVVVAFRRPAGSTQVADVLQCGTGTSLRSITLPIH